MEAMYKGKRIDLGQGMACDQNQAVCCCVQSSLAGASILIYHLTFPISSLKLEDTEALIGVAYERQIVGCEVLPFGWPAVESCLEAIGDVRPRIDNRRAGQKAYHIFRQNLLFQMFEVLNVLVKIQLTTSRISARAYVGTRGRRELMPWERMVRIGFGCCPNQFPQRRGAASVVLLPSA